MKKILFTVTNDLTYDQRMIRICTSLAQNGYDVTLIGKKQSDSVPITKMPFRQKRLSCFFHGGFLFYAAFNLRLFFYLLVKRTDIICAIDLDTILPCYVISKIKRVQKVYDAHELFCEMKEIASRPHIYRFWKKIERLTVPAFLTGYTVNEFIAAEFNKMYGVHYEIIRNMPVLYNLSIPEKPERYILYQGAVNEGRCFETLIPAMKYVDARLIICGDGNFMQKAKSLAIRYELNDKIMFTGKLTPAELSEYTLKAYIGVTLFDDAGLSNYYSLANRFFDYMHAGVPQICVNYPGYQAIISEYEFAVLITDLSAEGIAGSLNKLLHEEMEYRRIQANCLAARKLLNWKQEEKRLLSFYQKLDANG